MGPIAYSVCQKPFIGTAMWMMSLCTFPPLFSAAPIDLSSAGTTTTRSFRAPVEKSYPLAVTFEFSSVEARLNDQVVGDRYNEQCKGDTRYDDIPEPARKGLGRPIPFRVVLRRAEDRSVVVDQIFISLCATSHNGRSTKTRIIGLFPLQVGDYTAEITNLEAQEGLTDVKTAISLYAGMGK